MAGKGGERSIDRAREAGPSKRGGMWAPEEGGQQVLEGGCRGRSALACSVWAVDSNVGGDVAVWTQVEIQTIISLDLVLCAG